MQVLTMANIHKPTQYSNYLPAILITAVAGMSTGAVASPGNLSNVPLYLGTSAEPNIFFTIDDSGSMDWEVMTRDLNNGGRFTGTQPDGSSPAGSGAVKHRDSQADGNQDGNADCGFGTNGQDFYGYIYGVEFGSNTYGDSSWDCNTADEQEWRFRNSDFNPLYFDPGKKYEPWIGVDSSGIPFQDINITNAPNNPYNPTETIDLTVHNSNWAGGTSRSTSDRDFATDPGPDGFFYYTWADLDGDGLFEDGEETQYKIKDQDAATQQNFANWFAYYRNREFVVKAAYGQVIGEAEGVRMGLVTLHNHNNVKTGIASMNSDPSTGAKRTLLDNLYSIDSSGGTPLRSVNYDAGRYLECASNNLFGSCPALSAADGGACQQNFDVVMTDGFYNGWFDFPGGNNKDGDNDTEWDGGLFADSYDNTLADIAMHFYERDLQTSLDDEVPTTTGVDEATHQHVVTYTVAYGVDGTLTAAQIPPDDWPNPTAGDAEKIDDLAHAAYNGRGLFLSARDPDQLVTALQDAINDISERTGGFASVAFNTGSLETDSSVFLALSNSSKWTGQLLSFALNPLNGDVSASATWDAGAVLDSRNLGNSPRTILTYDGSDGIPFQWDNLSVSQKDDLRTNPVGGIDNDIIAEGRLDFLRGDRTNEGSGYNFRLRGGRLGDVIHAAPVFVGKPELSWPDSAPFPTGGSSYSTFKQSNSRTEVVYVGANDGMVHGFQASDGEEVLAYVPDSLFSTTITQGLHYLTDPGYAHRYYVDLSPTVSDVYMNGGWHTVLIGGERTGGRALFALDITDPAAFSETNAGSLVLWEFSHADLGYTFSRPTVAMLNNNQWAVIFGNGYNDTGSGEAALFILFLEAGMDGAWSAGDFLRISTGVGSAADRNGLANPAVVDLDGNGTADRVYAGDLRGNLWAFDLCNESGNSGCSDTGWDVAYKQGQAPKPLFTTANGQPITTTPAVVRHPTETTSTSNEPNLMVLFGTGQYLVDSDKSSTDTQSFYSVWDKGTKALDRSNLLPQTLTNSGTARLITDTAVNYSNTFGCYLDLIGSGERVAVDPVVRGDLVFFNTAIPSSEVCGSGGSGFQMSIDYLNCGQPDEPVFDYNRDGEIDDGDKVNGKPPVGEQFDDGLPAAPAILGNYIYTPGTETDGGEKPVVKRLIQALPSANTGRLSWEELLID